MYFETVSQRQAGQPLDDRRELCAMVAVEATLLIHGRVQPRSRSLLEACNDYWRASGGEQIGGWEDPVNWRRPVDRVMAFQPRAISLEELSSKPGNQGRGLQPKEFKRRF